MVSSGPDSRLEVQLVNWTLQRPSWFNHPPGQSLPLEVIPSPVAVAGADGAILVTNAAWDRLFNPRRSNGRGLGDFFAEAAGAVGEVLRSGDTSARRALPLTSSRSDVQIWCDLDLVPHPDAPGMVLIFARDVTDQVLARRDAEDQRQALAPADARLRLAGPATGIGTWEWDTIRNRLAWSPEQFRLHGLDPATGSPPSLAEWLDIVHPEDRSRIERAPLSGFNRTRDATSTVEFRIRRCDTGIERRLLSLCRVMEWTANDEPAQVLGVTVDVTEQRNEQATQNQHQAMLRLAASAAGVFAWDWDLATGKVIWGDGLESATGLQPNGVGGSIQAFRALVHPDDAPAVEAALRRALDGETSEYRATFRMLRPDGSERWTNTGGVVIRDSHGRARRVIGMDHDITDIKAAEGALRIREAQQIAIARLGHFALRASSSVPVMHEAVRVLVEMLGVELAKVLELRPDGQAFVLRAGHGWSDAYPVNQACVSAGRESQAGYTLLQDAGPVFVDDLPSETRFTGQKLLLDHGVISGLSVIIRGDGDSPYGVLGVHSRQRRIFTEQDIRFLTAAADVIGAAIQRDRTEAALAHSEALFRTAMQALPDMITITSADGVSQFKNQRWYDYTGQTLAEAQGAGWAAALHPDDREQAKSAWDEAVTQGQTYQHQHRLRGKDGRYRWFLTRSVPMRDAAGRIERWVSTTTDISDIVAAQQAAAQMAAALKAQVAERTRSLTQAAVELQAEMRRRQDAQMAALQAQKLEALGQLTAGVAHDFNNALMAVQSSFRLIERRTEDPRLRSLALAGQAAAEQGASIARQLLDFGRSESLTPVELDVAAALEQADTLIGYAAGRSIERVVDVQPGVWSVLADAHQLGVALLNLAINARDAMPDGGTMTLSARNLRPAERPPVLQDRDYVMIAVSDTGDGMPPEVAARAMEPFFTTKPAGKGTGLGLPMVQAFARRSGGCVRIDSRQGAGTTVQIILPRAAFIALATEPDAAGGVDGVTQIRAGTILLVDDEELVRTITADYLRGKGFKVLAAPSMEVAIVLSHPIDDLDMLVTDVRMPGSSGIELAARLRTERRNLPVLFITAHPDDEDLAGESVLVKPFTGADILRAISRQITGAQDGSTADGGLLRRLKDPALVTAYLFWRAARNGDRPPRLPDLDWGGLPDAEHGFVAAVEPDGETVSFRFLKVGRALLDRLGCSLEELNGTLDRLSNTDDEVLGSLANAYRRCTRTLSPSYEHARFDFGDGMPVSFERVILPVSNDGERVTHLVGLAVFSGDFDVSLYRGGKHDGA